jgi:cell division protease FtsH
MVTEFGISDKLGSVRYAAQELQYLGGAVTDSSGLSPHTLETIDGEVQRIVGAQYERAQRLLQDHRPALASLTEQLLKSETLDGSVVRQAVEPRAVRATAS